MQMIYAKFIGEDGSLGFERNEHYFLFFWEATFAGGKAYWVKREDGRGDCPYQSIESFWENWSVEGVVVNVPGTNAYNDAVHNEFVSKRFRKI